jgi:hypothetical protein
MHFFFLFSLFILLMFAFSTIQQVYDATERGLNYPVKLQQTKERKASKQQILVSLAALGLRIGLSAIFWDRSVKNYQDLVDSVPNSLVQQVIDKFGRSALH